MPQNEIKRRPFQRTKRTLAVVLSLAVVVAIVGAVTPAPSATLIRAVFKKGGEDTAREMEKYVTDIPLTETLDIQYGQSGQSSTMDVFTPEASGKQLPTVFWVHGGAWVAGSKEDVAPYLRILAAEGFTTVGVNYPLGPEGHYPQTISEINDALEYLLDHSEELGVDPQQIIFAGDSAGAQIASQLAAITTNPDYAYILGVDPAIKADQLKATILNCGVYDLGGLSELTGILGWGLKTSMWAYTGTKSWAVNKQGATMSTIDWVTEDFPATYISGGNSDGLTWSQSIPMAQKLSKLNVPVTPLFWPADHNPGLKHEYQFHLDLPEAQEALQETIKFLKANTK